MTPTDPVFGSLVVGFWIAVAFVAVLWIILPFAVFGLKPLVRELILQQKRTNVLLELATRNARERNAPDGER